MKRLNWGCGRKAAPGWINSDVEASPGERLRLGLPDLDRAVAAYLARDSRYFCVPDADAKSIGGKLCIQATWYGCVRTPFTYDFAQEVLSRAGFSAVWRVSLDNRERETFFVEAIR